MILVHVRSIIKEKKNYCIKIIISRSKSNHYIIEDTFFSQYDDPVQFTKQASMNRYINRGARSKQSSCKSYTLISPAKQCTSMPSGTTPKFN